VTAGEHVALRAIERRDLEQLRAWRNRPQLQRHFRQSRELTAQDQVAWFENVVERDPSTRMFAIEERERGRLLGACGLCFVNWASGTAELSIYIGVDDLYVDDRFAPEAAGLLVDHAFDDLDLHRLWVEIYAFDTRKQRLFEDLGFVLEGRFREHCLHEGERHDSLFYGLLRPERGRVAGARAASADA
jgi:RimJ/RimL family protein N-acetyltransferase